MRKPLLVLFVVAALPVLLRAPAQASCKNPRLLIVLDKSSSMLGKVSTETKWQIATAAITTVLNSYGSTIDFGLMVFPNPNQCGPGSVKVPIGPGTKGQIISVLADPPPSGGNWTPMAQSLDVVPDVVELQDASYSNHVLLITDGWQWCDPYQPSTRFLPVNSVAALTAGGITSHIVGFGDGVDALTLNKMADAAKTKVSGSCDVAGSDPTGTNNCYYQANNPQQLLQALQTIAKNITQEMCDGLDNDCNGLVDDGLSAPPCTMQLGVCQGATKTCGGGQGFVVCGEQTYLDYAKNKNLVYQQTETLCDGLDNDCDGTTDEGCSCVDGETRSCGQTKGECREGTQTCANGVWGQCTGEVTSSTEVCDGKDNDCDGKVDEDLVRPCNTICGQGNETCVGGKYSGCTATEPATETCDGIDNDCDGVVDEGDDLCPSGQVCHQGRCHIPVTNPSGCDCQIEHTTAAGALPLLFVLGLLVWWRRRRADLGG
jgi:MYXO-CTERM domain-containing protein